MARIEAGVYSILSASTWVTYYTSTRIYPRFLPQDCPMPALCFDILGQIRHSTFADDPDRSEARIEITALATSVSGVNNLADGIRHALYRYVGTAGGVTIQDCWLEDEAGAYFSDIEEYGNILNYSILFTETTS